jgi:hypothetical protein
MKWDLKPNDAINQGFFKIFSGFCACSSSFDLIELIFFISIYCEKGLPTELKDTSFVVLKLSYNLV